uniref:Uncharacterized protein n=1 Tax=Ciona intestinalis TaxID=7719 RepID=H2XXG7_CIOIN
MRLVLTTQHCRDGILNYGLFNGHYWLCF